MIMRAPSPRRLAPPQTAQPPPSCASRMPSPVRCLSARSLGPPVGQVAVLGPAGPQLQRMASVPSQLQTPRQTPRSCLQSPRQTPVCRMESYSYAPVAAPMPSYAPPTQYAAPVARNRSSASLQPLDMDSSLASKSSRGSVEYEPKDKELMDGVQELCQVMTVISKRK